MDETCDRCGQPMYGGFHKCPCPPATAESDPCTQPDETTAAAIAESESNKTLPEPQRL